MVYVFMSLYGQGHTVEGQLHKGKFCRSRSQGRNDQITFLHLGVFKVKVVHGNTSG